MLVVVSRYELMRDDHKREDIIYIRENKLAVHFWPFRGGTPGVYRGRGKEARLCYEGHVLMDNRQGLVVDVKITEATGTSERDAALDMLQMVPSSGRITVGADRGVRHEGLRMGLPGHAHHTARGSETTLGDRWTDHPSQRIQVESACAQTC